MAEALTDKPFTNFFKYSEQFDNEVWGLANVSITADTDLAPDGTLTADSILSTCFLFFLNPDFHEPF